MIQWIYDTYGRHRAALTAVVICYRARGAVREVGKALGVPEDVTAALVRSRLGLEHAMASPRSEVKDLNLNLDDPRLRLTLELARELIGAPRHLSQHPGGFVLTQDRLDDLVPIEPAAMENRQVIEWDKNDIDILKFMKVDVLGLGMLGCMRRAFDLLREHKGIDHDLASIPAEDPKTYDMIRKADTVGVFQIESRAQMAMLPRMKPRNFYDLVIEVAIVRPGPIQGDMVHPYLRRREGREEAVTTRRRSWSGCWARRSGVPLFQEQAMRVAIECAGFTPSEADQLRRAMATFKFNGGVSKFRDKLVNGMIERGYDRGFRRAHLQAARRLRLLWLSGKPRRLLRLDRLCVVLDEMPPSRCVLLRASSTRSRWASMRRRSSCAMRSSTASRSGRSTSTTRAGTARWSRRERAALRRAPRACGWPRGLPMRTAP